MVTQNAAPARTENTGSGPASHTPHQLNAHSALARTSGPPIPPPNAVVPVSAVPAAAKLAATATIPVAESVLVCSAGHTHATARPPATAPAATGPTLFLPRLPPASAPLARADRLEEPFIGGTLRSVIRTDGCWVA
jgi:hypothetical protein